jgi:hypothetical protein
LNGADGTARVFGDGSSVVDFGTGDSILLAGDNGIVRLSGADATLRVTGDGATVLDFGTGDTIDLRGDHENATVIGSNATIKSTGCDNAITVAGSGDSVDASHASITVGSGVTTSVNGDHNAIALGTGSTLTLTGKLNDVLTVSSPDDSDTLVLGNVSHGRLWFAQNNEDLVISVIGKHESITVSDWFDAPDSHIGTIQTADGFSISDAGVDQLVQAMSAFSPPSFGHWHNEHGEANALAPVLAASWQQS